MNELPDKLRGVKDGPVSELTKLKALWNKWPDEERQKLLSWREEIEPKPVTNAEIRARIKKYYGISLVRDGQLSEFWSWCSSRRADDALNDFMAARQQAVIDAHPDWDRDQIRDAMIKEWYAVAHATGDAELGLKVAATDLKDKEGGRDERRIAILEKKAAAYDRAQAAINEAKNSKGGITPETLTKIERELKLL